MPALCASFATELPRRPELRQLRELLKHLDSTTVARPQATQDLRRPDDLLTFYKLTRSGNWHPHVGCE
jgi:hypothetical protein